MTDYREHFANQMGLPVSARFKHPPEDVEEIKKRVRSNQPTHSDAMVTGRALAILDAKQYQRAQARSFIVTKDHNWRRKLEVTMFVLMFLFCLVMATRAHGQTTTIQGRAKGATAANTATVTSVDANHNAIDVNIASGGGSGGTASNFGAAFPATGTAVGASDGVNMGPLLIDGSGNLKVNCLAGCAGGSTTPSDAFANPTTAGLQMTFNAMYNGATWDRVRGDTTNGLWVNCKNGCAGGSTTPTDAFANPTTAGLSMGFSMMWNGATWDRVKGDTTSGIWINVKNSTLAVTQSTSPWVISFTAPQHTISDSGTITSVTQLNGANVPTADYDTGAGTVTTPMIGIAVPASGGPVAAPGDATNGLKVQAADGTVFVRQTAGSNLHVQADAGSAIIGKVGIDQTTPGTTNLVAAGQNGTWSVRAQDGAGNALTTNSSTYTAKFALDMNLLGTLGTAFSTAGKVDVKGADGDVFVRQATAANLNATVVGTLADNGVAAATNRIATLPAVAQTSYENGTASTQGRNAALNAGTDGLLWVANLPAIRPASFTASAAFAGSSTTDIARLPGNASNTVLVTEIKFSCTQTTAGSVTVTVNKRSTAGSGGTSANITVVPDDSNYAAGVSVPVSYTGTGPTVGTLVGAIDNMKVGCLATTTAAPQDIYILNLRQKPIVLRGTAENVAINLGGAVTGGNVTVTFRWIETATITP